MVARVAQYYDEMRRKVAQLSSLARARLDAAAGRVSVRTGALVSSAHRQLDHRERAVEHAVTALGRLAGRRLEEERVALHRRSGRLSVSATRRLGSDGVDLERCRQVLAAYDPDRQLRRGWSLTHRASGELVRSIEQLAEGEEIVTRVADGTVESVVRARSAREDDEP